MSSIRARDVKSGNKLLLNNEPFVVLSNDYFSPGKGKPVSRIKLKNLLDNKIFIKTFRSTDNIELADIFERDVKFLYFDGNYNFIDTETLEYYEMDINSINNTKDWLIVDKNYTIILWNNNPLLLKVPKIVTLKVISTEDISRSTVAAKNMKSAVLENNIVIKVPLFIKVGDKVRIDTEKRQYLSRVN